MDMAQAMELATLWQDVAAGLPGSCAVGANLVEVHATYSKSGRLRVGAKDAPAANGLGMVGGWASAFGSRLIDHIAPLCSGLSCARVPQDLVCNASWLHPVLELWPDRVPPATALATAADEFALRCMEHLREDEAERSLWAWRQSLLLRAMVVQLRTALPHSVWPSAREPANA